MAQVLIKSGRYRQQLVMNTTFTLVKGLTVGGRSGDKFITVDAEAFGIDGVARIKVDKNSDFVILEDSNKSVVSTEDENEETDADVLETDEEIIIRMNRKFDTLDKFTGGSAQGYIKSLVVTGAPGVGKTYGVERVLNEEIDLDAPLGVDEAPAFELVTGTMSAIGLYMKMYTHRQEGHVLVLDDCDSIFEDSVALNLLKAALDTKESRRIYWGKLSNALMNEGIPDHFDFKGSIIFISNLDFRRIRSAQRKAHFAALMSRSHFLDLTVHTARECVLRINYVLDNSPMLEKFHLKRSTVESIKRFITDNSDQFNELSLRLVVKLAGLAKAVDEDEHEWKSMARESLMGNALGF